MAIDTVFKILIVVIFFLFATVFVSVGIILLTLKSTMKWRGLIGIILILLMSLGYTVNLFLFPPKVIFFLLLFVNVAIYGLLLALFVLLYVQKIKIIINIILIIVSIIFILIILFIFYFVYQTNIFEIH